MEQEIVSRLRTTFSPAAIILHGSRASGHAREHSDWDFILLYNDSDTPNNGRFDWQGQNLEFSHHELPIGSVFEEFGVKLQNARVVFEENGEGTELLARAQKEYRKPLNWTAEERTSHALWVQGRIEGMQDCIDSPLLFEKYAADFYSRITNYWYWAIHDSYPKPIYIALEEIKAKDPEYFVLIENFVNTEKREEKIAVANEVKARCFS